MLVRVVIADDEQATLDYISSLPDWQRLGCEVVGRAGNGWEAYELVEQLRPDLLVTDIRMPVMDGIELAEWASRAHPAMQIIFLTAYSEFEYAKQAVKLGAVDFITKPFQAEELMESIQYLQHVGMSGKGSSAVEKEELLQLMLDPAVEPAAKQATLEAKQLAGRQVLIVAAEVDNAQRMQQTGVRFSKLTMRDKLAEVAGRFPYPYWTTLAQAGVHFILFIPEGQADKASTEVFSLARGMLAVCEASFAYPVSFAISNVLGSLLELDQGMGEIRRSLNYRMLLGKHSIISISAVEDIQQEQHMRRQMSLTDLEQLLSHGEQEQLKGYMRQVYREAVSSGWGKQEVHRFALDIVSAAEKALREQETEFPGDWFQVRMHVMAFDILSDLMRYLEQQLMLAMAAIAQVRTYAAGSTMAKIRQYIELHYQEDISLHTLAEALYMNYSYLSRMIKKEAGYSFRHLLWEYRIGVAKSKLAAGHMKSADIAFSVGFKDPSHFSKVFKQMVGVSPADYAKSAARLER